MISRSAEKEREKRGKKNMDEGGKRKEEMEGKMGT